MSKGLIYFESKVISLNARWEIDNVQRRKDKKIVIQMEMLFHKSLELTPLLLHFGGTSLLPTLNFKLTLDKCLK